MFTKDKLHIFEDFQEDSSLKPPPTEYQYSNIQLTTASMRSAPVFDGATVLVADSDAPRIRVGRPPLWERVWATVVRILIWWKETRERSMTVEQFFSSVKLSAEELSVVQERAKGYEQAIVNAKKSNQIALYERLRADLSATRAEALLVAAGYKKFLTEQTVVNFVKKCEKGLRLDWMGNFTRVIPDDVMQHYEKVRSLAVFDNFVILHYDPHGKSWAETEAQKAKRKDPILFGVIRGQRKLYYVADWVDELCNLTLQDIAELLGKKAVEQLK
jgi:hypothetical protein